MQSIWKIGHNSLPGLASNKENTADDAPAKGPLTMKNLNDPNYPVNVSVDVTHGVEKFSSTDLMTLRTELLQSGVDSFQAAEIVANFLTGRGYGCSSHEARTVASNIEVQGATVEHIQAQLETLARVM